MTTHTDQLGVTIQDLRIAADSALANGTAGDFASFERFVNEVEAYARELQQSMWGDEARAAIRRLQSGGSLTPDDHDVIRAFMISDAQAYLEHENDYNNWIDELKRLIADIETRANNIDRESIADFRGVLKDVIRLVPDIRNFCAEKLRIEKFEEALLTLDPTSRKMLAQVMTEQLRSTNR